jgi:hypothetical protein
VSTKLVMSADDLWLLRLFVLIRASKGRISEESIVAEFERWKIGGVTITRIRRLLSSLVFVATREGQKAALEIRARLSPLLVPDDDRSSE